MLNGNQKDKFSQSQLYAPLKFTPLFSQKIWGGECLPSLFGIPRPEGDPVGEAWILSGVENKETRVSGGVFDGLKLSEVTEKLKSDLLGHKNWDSCGAKFPLLIKYIDAAQNLSVQVHPNDATAHRLGYPSGKTEMWYVLDAKPDAQLLVGFNRKLTADSFEKSVEDNTICDYIAHHDIHSGDCFLIPAGRIHAIGAGALILEIQQSADVTFRVYDFDRRDANGKRRQLHISQARESLDFTVNADCQTRYTPKFNERQVLEKTQFFTTSLYNLNRPYEIDCTADDCYKIVIATKGNAKLQDNWGNNILFKQNEILLIPAVTTQIKLQPETSEFQMIETHS